MWSLLEVVAQVVSPHGAYLINALKCRGRILYEVSETLVQPFKLVEDSTILPFLKHIPWTYPLI